MYGGYMLKNGLWEKMANIFSRIKLIWVDGAYGGTLIEIAKGCFNRTLEVVRRTDDNKGFKVLRKHWIVETTFGWLSNYRRNSKDYEQLLRILRPNKLLTNHTW